MDDCPMSGGSVLSGIACICRALEAYLRLHIDTLQAWLPLENGIYKRRLLGRLPKRGT